MAGSMKKSGMETHLIIKVIKQGLLSQFLALYIGNKVNGEVFKASPLIFTKMEPASEDIEPTAPLTETEAQVLMDSLWDCGIRPTEGAGSAGAMAAQGRHLEDMRSIVFKAIKQNEKGPLA